MVSDYPFSFLIKDGFRLQRKVRDFEKDTLNWLRQSSINSQSNFPSSYDPVTVVDIESKENSDSDNFNDFIREINEEKSIAMRVLIALVGSLPKEMVAEISPRSKSLH